MGVEGSSDRERASAAKDRFWGTIPILSRGGLAGMTGAEGQVRRLALMHPTGWTGLPEGGLGEVTGAAPSAARTGAIPETTWASVVSIIPSRKYNGKDGLIPGGEL